MPLRVVPLADRLAVAWLASAPEVTAIAGNRVATALDQNPTFPFLTCELLTGVEKSVGHLDEQYVRLRAYGTSRTNASSLIEVARAALEAAPTGSHTGAVVSHVRTASTPGWDPDDSVTPPRPMYRCDLAISLHP